jgi:hypothetical protein
MLSRENTFADETKNFTFDPKDESGSDYRKAQQELIRP